MDQPSGLSGRDVFLRYGAGPIQCFRVWDAATFIEARMQEGIHAEKPYVVGVHEEEEYRAQQRATARSR